MIMLDTSFLVAYYNLSDPHHQKACAILESLKKRAQGQFIITDYIFSEFVTVHQIRFRNHEKTVLNGKDVQQFTMTIHTEEDTFQHAWVLFKEQKETALSFADCSILAIMKQYHISEIVTFDKDFEKIKDIHVIKA